MISLLRRNPRISAAVPRFANFLSPAPSRARTSPSGRLPPLRRDLFSPSCRPQLASTSALAQSAETEVFETIDRDDSSVTASKSVQAPADVDVDSKGDGGVSEKGGGGLNNRDEEEDDALDISKLGISNEIVSRLAERGITKLFPIQKAVLEPAAQGRDVIGRAKTGTGKTLAFCIPIIDKITRHIEKHGRGRYPLALVLAPTRELARQLDKEFRDTSDLDTVCVYGGVSIHQQVDTLDSGVDVVIGTPGRIIYLLKNDALNLSEVQFFVIDEADQMLNVAFVRRVEYIMEKLPQNHQTLMFSFTTMPAWIERITKKYLNDPLIIDLVGDTDQKLPEGISVYSIVSEDHKRPSIVGPLITEHAKEGKCIVFTESKHDAERLAYVVGPIHTCQILHQDIPQKERELTLSGFRNGRFNTLIATDIAARGLDIPNVDLVVHYGIPGTSELFIHRSGRTGRAGKKGQVILIYTDDQSGAVKFIERDVGCKFIGLPKIEVEFKDEDLFGFMPDEGFDSYGCKKASTSPSDGGSRSPSCSGGLSRTGQIRRSSDHSAVDSGHTFRSSGGTCERGRSDSFLSGIGRFAFQTGRSDSLFGFLRSYVGASDDGFPDSGLKLIGNNITSGQRHGLGDANSAAIAGGRSIFDHPVHPRSGHVDRSGGSGGS